MLLNLHPAFKNYLWGGDRLKLHFGKQSPNNIIAESWELSCHPDGVCIIANHGGIPLPQWLEMQDAHVLGTNCARFEQFPILIKLIDARERLSIQVHPDDSYAFANENSPGKTEVWYIVDCEPNASLYYGLKCSVSKAQFSNAIEDGSLLELLNEVAVKPGDVFFIEPGTIHAIGPGILIAEIQQSSNLTYRVYDYNRQDANGNQRELHIDKALAVSNLDVARTDYDFQGHLALSDYFSVDLLQIEDTYQGNADSRSFHHLLVLHGQGEITDETEAVSLKKGSSILVTANSGKYQIRGKAEILLTVIP